MTPVSFAETEQAATQESVSATEAGSTTIARLLATATSNNSATGTPPAQSSSSAQGTPYLYTAQSGDTLAAVAARFGVAPEEIASPQDIPDGLIAAGQIFTIPNVLGISIPSERILPDSEVIDSPSAAGFSAGSYAGPFAGHLTKYREYLPSGWHDGPAVVERVAMEQSINPRLLLSVLQYQSNWVLGDPVGTNAVDYPIGYVHPQQRGLYHQLAWAARQLSIGYYGWRDGSLTELTFRDGVSQRIPPDLNAGTVAIQFLFAQLYDNESWLGAMDTNAGFPFTHSEAMFPDPWGRAEQIEPLFPTALEQPHLSLPFYNTQIWYFTSGPHGAWDREGAMAALDFAPSSSLPGCVPSGATITAAASGLVVRSDNGIVVVDLDNDGREQTGWVILYLHVTNNDDLRVGDWVDRGDPLGNPSCEGGLATASHLHIARKYNGEWIAASGPLPFNMSGWVSQNDGALTWPLAKPPYLGSLARDGVSITACVCSNVFAQIAFSSNDPY